MALFQSTHPLRGATGEWYSDTVGKMISIHAPLAGCDEILRLDLQLFAISIHAPLAGCDGTALNTTPLT